MAKFICVIEEVLRREVQVEARTPAEARAIVGDRYNAEDIVLGADDFSEYGIYIKTEGYGTDNEN